MKDLLWDGSLSVQVEEVDDDHRRLVELFNILKNSVDKGASEDYIDAVVEELITCTIWHFRHEERLMLKYGYTGLAEHKAEHEELIESAIQLQQKFWKNNRTLPTEDIEYLEQWLTGHILGLDMDMGAYLSEKM